MDNVPQGAPVIPAGTEKTVFGTNSFTQYNQRPNTPDSGQAPNTPNASQPQTVGQQGNQQPISPQAVQPQVAVKPTTFEELAKLKGFQTPDDMARAYSESEAQKTRVEMGLAELIRVRQEAVNTPNQPQVPNQPMPSMNQVVDDAIGVHDNMTQEEAIKVVQRIVEKSTKPLQDQLALQDLFFNTPDARQYASRMADVVKREPGVSWETAYRSAKFDDLVNQTKEQGQQIANVPPKQAAIVGQAAPARSTERPLDEIIADRSIPFTEVQRIMRERFSQ